MGNGEQACSECEGIVMDIMDIIDIIYREFPETKSGRKHIAPLLRHSLQAWQRRVTLWFRDPRMAV